MVLEAYEAGCRRFGENKVQEGLAKAEELASLPDIEWSLIGHLQTNKARDAARFATEFQALDSLRVAEALDRRLQASGRGMDVLIEVDTSGGPSHGQTLCDLRGMYMGYPEQEGAHCRVVLEASDSIADEVVKLIADFGDSKIPVE